MGNKIFVEYSNSILALSLEDLWPKKVDRTQKENVFCYNSILDWEDKEHVLRIFLKEALVEPAEGHVVVMVDFYPSRKENSLTDIPGT